MSATKIEWTNRTWNPVTGCTKVSPGCDHCYAENIARRFAGSKAFPNGFDVTLHRERLEDPTRWRKPARVFVNSMSDLFHDDVPDSFIADVWDTMRRTPQHTYQILTKRPGRMRSLLKRWTPVTGVPPWAWTGPWPLPNVWLGVSTEDQRWANVRVVPLLDTPAAVRFVSAEPLLGPIDFAWCNGVSALGPDWTGGATGGTGAPHPLLDWVIVGGESGPGARRMELGWATDIVRQCQREDVPVFVKQLGTAHGPHKGGDIFTWPTELQVRQYPATAVAS